MDDAQSVQISSLNSFQNAGVVPRVITVETVEELQDCIQKYGTELAILGAGSNTLISPNTQKIILKISPKFGSDSCNGDEVTVPAGYSVHQVLKTCTHYEKTGLEFIAGVPASVGGMIAMNYGCWGTDISEHLVRIEVVDAQGRLQTRDCADLDYGYRYSNIQAKGDVVISATFRLQSDNKDAIRERIREVVKTRSAKQPLGAKTFGSTFKNPDKAAAGALIDASSLKGHAVGAAQISEQHANFMINTGGASYEDARALIQSVQEQVKVDAGVDLIPEVCFID